MTSEETASAMVLRSYTFFFLFSEKQLLSYTTFTRILHGSQQECRTWFEQEHRILHRNQGYHRKTQSQANPFHDYHCRNAHSFDHEYKGR